MVFLTVTLGAVAAFPAGAAAKPGYYAIPGGVAAEFVLPKDNGFSLEILNAGRRQIDLMARRGAETVLYSAPGHVSSRRLSANFGRFGRLDVRFHPSSSVGDSLRDDRCHGPDPVERAGSFTGTIRFHDPGVATVATRRAVGLVTRSFRTVCKRQKPRRHGSSQGKSAFEARMLSARSQRGNRVVSFHVFSISSGGADGLELTFVGAGLRESFGRVLVDRSTNELAEGSEVVFSRRGVHPEQVAVAGPPPFAGRASYLESPSGPPTWTGDLSVPVAGRGRVALTGPGFHARLCRAESLQALFDCAPGGEASSLRLRLNSSARGPLPLRPRAPVGRAGRRSATLR